MTALTIIETALLVLALIYIVALLRSHADILRRLAALENGAGAARSLDDVTADAGAVRIAADISGVTLDGDAVKLSLGAGAPPTLLAFLTSGCAACAAFWDGLRDASALTNLDERLVVITHDPSSESATRLRALAPSGLEVIMASPAWTAYAVPSSPHFILTDGAGGISGRGSAASWSQLLTMLGDARSDVGPIATSARTTEERAERAERALAHAGIGPGHPSLYPGESPDGNGGGS